MCSFGLCRSHGITDRSNLSLRLTLCAFYEPRPVVILDIVCPLEPGPRVATARKPSRRWINRWESANLQVSICFHFSISSVSTSCQFAARWHRIRRRLRSPQIPWACSRRSRRPRLVGVVVSCISCGKRNRVPGVMFYSYTCMVDPRFPWALYALRSPFSFRNRESELFHVQTKIIRSLYNGFVIVTSIASIEQN